jgi:hypothetical protein
VRPGTTLLSSRIPNQHDEEYIDSVPLLFSPRGYDSTFANFYLSMELLEPRANHGNASLPMRLFKLIIGSPSSNSGS